ncbi:Flavanone 3-dioxygenase [Handroanthus impetiginosus]|uniref:Flavanone 3-dioxygenase n=1 Tax=Handroanthus impetiginosus TaxID=429701 RepID=A0A2G9G9T5_9LAMI|nr:Flavanone 3-dioxygenase [Handroanthus impetiginosus]
MYSTEVRKLRIELFEAILESLNLDETHVKEKFKQGFQIIGINCYPPCLGSDNVPLLKGFLQVLIGDHMEVISNGLYKSVSHRATPSGHDTRLSIASLQSQPMDEIVELIAKLKNEENPKKYRGSSLRDFLKHHASRDTRAFIETLKVD